ncbi:hypothetical protein ACFE04_017561 [Oxalis oulophora]
MGMFTKRIKLSGRIVAIKMLKHTNFKTVWNNNEEGNNLKKLQQHPSIIKLHETIRYDTELNFVLEYMDCDLKQLIEESRNNLCPFSEFQIKDWCFQIFHGLTYMHQLGYIHHDLNPANLLFNNQNNVIKITDIHHDLNLANLLFNNQNNVIKITDFRLAWDINRYGTLCSKFGFVGDINSYSAPEIIFK